MTSMLMPVLVRINEMPEEAARINMMPVGDGSFRLYLNGKQMLALCAYIAYNICMQYTIRNVPETLDAALRQSAREQGKSLNAVAVEALARGAGLMENRCRQRDLADIAGSWRKDPAFDSAVAAQDTVDDELWR